MSTQTVERYRRPIVAIVGRPNVGKSTLFNRILGTRWAITDGQPGVTRDQIFAEAEWGGRSFTLVDTGGYIPNAKDALSSAVRSQAANALAEADIAIFLCDGTTGLTDLDQEMGAMLRSGGGKCLLAVNKVDGVGPVALLDEFYRLGLGDPLPISAVTGRRSGALLDALIALFDEPEAYGSEWDEEAIRVALVGRPNVGKSTLINHLAGHQVSIVHDQPGTTRDPTQLRLTWQDSHLLFVDTAGLRRRSKVDDPVEFYSTRRAANSIDQADVAVVLLDSVEGWVMQDARIMEQVIKSIGAMLVLAALRFHGNTFEHRRHQWIVGVHDNLELQVMSSRSAPCLGEVCYGLKRRPCGGCRHWIIAQTRLYFYLASLGHIHLPSYPALFYVEQFLDSFCVPSCSQVDHRRDKGALRCAAI